MFFLLDHEFSWIQLNPAAMQDGDRTLDISFFQREAQEALPATPSAVTKAPPEAPGCSYRSPGLPVDVPVTWGPIGASSGEHPVGRGTRAHLARSQIRQSMTESNVLHKCFKHFLFATLTKHLPISSNINFSRKRVLLWSLHQVLSQQKSNLNLLEWVYWSHRKNGLRKDDERWWQLTFHPFSSTTIHSPVTSKTHPLTLLIPTGSTLWWTNIAMENHHFSWENPL